MFNKLFKSSTTRTTTTTVIASGNGAMAAGGSITINGSGNRVAGPGSHHNTFSSTPSVSLSKKIDASKISLTKASLTDRKMAVRVYLDESGSMGEFYRNSTMQTISDRALGFVLAMDDDGSVPLFSFGTNHYNHGDLTIDNYLGFVSRNITPKGSTNLSASLENLEKAAKTTDIPIYALIITDGVPNDKYDVATRIKRLAQYPVFIKILVVGHDASAWKYISDLDNLTVGRLLDNVDAQQMNNPAKLTDQQFADKMVEELAGWFKLATTAGII